MKASTKTNMRQSILFSLRHTSPNRIKVVVLVCLIISSLYIQSRASTLYRRHEGIKNKEDERKNEDRGMPGSAKLMAKHSYLLAKDIIDSIPSL